MTGKLRLGDHCLKIGSGATPRGGKEAYLANGTYSLIRSQNVLNERFSIGGLAFISQDQADQLSNVEVQPDDVLLNITGDSVARVCQVDPLVLPARVNQHVAIIRPKPEVIDPRFLRYFMVSPEMQAHMLGLAASGATRNALTKGMIEKFEIPAVPLSEQRTIAATLGALDDKIELNRKMNATLEAMARTLFRDWFVDFGPTRAKMEGREHYLSPDIWALFPDRLDDEGKPEGWQVSTIGDVAKNHSETMDLKKRQKVIFINTGDVSQGRFLHKDYSDAKILPGQAKKKVKFGDILYSEIRPKNKRFAFINFDASDHIVSTKFMVLRAISIVSPIHLYFLVSSREAIAEFDLIAESRSGTFPQITFDSIKHYPIMVAGHGIMNAFSNILELIFNFQWAKDKENEALIQTRNLLLPRLMSGELRVADLAKHES